MDTQEFSLGSVAKRGKSTHLFRNQPALPNKIFELFEAQSSLYSKFYSCNGSYGGNYCGSLLSLSAPSFSQDTHKEEKENFKHVCHQDRPVKTIQQDAVDFPGSQEPALMEVILQCHNQTAVPYKFHTLVSTSPEQELSP